MCLSVYLHFLRKSMLHGVMVGLVLEMVDILWKHLVSRLRSIQATNRERVNTHRAPLIIFIFDRQNYIR